MMGLRNPPINKKQALVRPNISKESLQLWVLETHQLIKQALVRAKGQSNPTVLIEDHRVAACGG
jgi:hypothetical protein